MPRNSYPIDEGGKRFVPVMQGFRMACCDCGLVHVIDFEVIERIRPLKNGKWEYRLPAKGERFRVAMTARRDNRATGQLRRHRGLRAVQVKP